MSFAIAVFITKQLAPLCCAFELGLCKHGGNRSAKTSVLDLILYNVSRMVWLHCINNSYAPIQYKDVILRV